MDRQKKVKAMDKFITFITVMHYLYLTSSGELSTRMEKVKVIKKIATEKDIKNSS